LGINAALNLDPLKEVCTAESNCVFDVYKIGFISKIVITAGNPVCRRNSFLTGVLKPKDENPRDTFAELPDTLEATNNLLDGYVNTS